MPGATPGSVLQKKIDYLAAGVFADNALTFIPTAEGRALPPNTALGGTAFRYEYQQTDHLDNLRTACRCAEKLDSLGNVVALLPSDNLRNLVQENAYDPWGLNLPDLERGAVLPDWWQFSTKERDYRAYDEFEFRHYDAAIGRFMSIDPLFQQFRGISPFNYADNNPSTYIDLYGLQAIKTGGPGIFNGGFFSSEYTFEAASAIGKKSFVPYINGLGGFGKAAGNAFLNSYLANNKPINPNMFIPKQIVRAENLNMASFNVGKDEVLLDEVTVLRGEAQRLSDANYFEQYRKFSPWLPDAYGFQVSAYASSFSMEGGFSTGIMLDSYGVAPYASAGLGLGASSPGIDLSIQFIMSEKTESSLPTTLDFVNGPSVGMTASYGISASVSQSALLYNGQYRPTSGFRNYSLGAGLGFGVGPGYGYKTNLSVSKAFLIDFRTRPVR